MNFWDYKLLAKRLHKKQISQSETVIFFLIYFIFGIFSLFIYQAIAVFVWHMKMSSVEKRLMKTLSRGDFLLIILVLSCPSYIRSFVYGLIIFFVSLFFILGSQSNKFAPLGLFFCVLCIYDMYKALRRFSRFEAWNATRKKPSHLDKLDGDASL